MSHIEGATLKIAIPPYQASVWINGRSLEMEVDTGSLWTLISAETFKLCGDQSDLKLSNAMLETYTEDKVSIIGEATVAVQFRADQAPKKLPLIVVKRQ